MKILIIACGDLGTTYKAGEKLRELIGGDLGDGKMKYDLGDYDAVVMGTNVRFGKFNKRFYKNLKKIKKADKDLYIYICGAEAEKSEHYVDAMRKEAPLAKDIGYFWGELDASRAKRMEKYAIESFITGRKKDGLAKPRLLDKKIRAFASVIKGEEN